MPPSTHTAWERIRLRCVVSFWPFCSHAVGIWSSRTASNPSYRVEENELINKDSQNRSGHTSRMLPLCTKQPGCTVWSWVQGSFVVSETRPLRNSTSQVL